MMITGVSISHTHAPLQLYCCSKSQIAMSLMVSITMEQQHRFLVVHGCAGLIIILVIVSCTDSSRYFLHLFNSVPFNFYRKIFMSCFTSFPGLIFRLYKCSLYSDTFDLQLILNAVCCTHDMMVLVIYTMGSW